MNDRNPIKSLSIFIALAVLGIAPYLPSLFAPYSVEDDVAYIDENVWVHEISLPNLKAIFTKPYLNNYLPFHLLSYAIDYRLWGSWPVGFRAENFLWHIGCVWITFIILRRLLGRSDAAFIGTLFFAVHPVCIESVPWIAERKNLMSQFFGLLSFWLYMTRREGKGRYLWSLATCIAALFSKTSIVVLPILLIAHQWFIEGERNIWKLALDKLPYFLIALLTGLATIHVQEINPETGNINPHGFIEKWMTTMVMWARYIRLIWAPFNVAAAYEMKTHGLSIVSVLATALMATYFLLALKLKKSYPVVSLGMFWVYISLLTVSNIIPFPVGIKNRYLYLPLVGSAMAMGQLWKSGIAIRRKPVIAAGTVALLCLMTLTCLRAIDAKSNVRDWRNAVRVAPQSSEAHAVLSFAYSFEGNDYMRILESGVTKAMQENLPTDRISIARMYLEKGAPQNTLEMCDRLLPIAPQNTNLLASCGMAALQRDKKEAATEYLKAAIELGSRESLPYLGLGILAFEYGDLDSAGKLLDVALKLSPDNVDAHLQLAVVLEKRDPKNALLHFQRVLELAPDHPSRESIIAYIKNIKNGMQ